MLKVESCKFENSTVDPLNESAKSHAWRAWRVCVPRAGVLACLRA